MQFEKPYKKYMIHIEKKNNQLISLNVSNDKIKHPK